MKHFAKIALILAVFAFTCSGALGQTVKTNSGKLYQLFTRDDVKKDLKLSADQRKKIDSTIDRLEAKYGIENSGGSRRSSGQVSWVDDMEQDIRKEILPLLSKAQVTRLEQLRIQIVGNKALAEKKIQDSLKMTQAQRDKVKKLISASEEDMKDIVQAANGQIDSKVMSQIKEISAQLNVDLGKILTAEQKSAFEKMKGPKLAS
ncbi:MAG: hypothetical protein KF836_09385 [Fimbriimonadaceae bacterium]|nr:hypothetical protein [Fimbriimonadaceae bacterium]